LKHGVANQKLRNDLFFCKIFSILLNHYEETPDHCSVKEDEGHVEGRKWNTLSKLLVKSISFLTMRVLQYTLSCLGVKLVSVGTRNSSTDASPHSFN
jgi:hypothetical protein